ncbi:MAG: hypothetical protein OEY64_04335 [Nitrospinota bacterium]|nr:hypothetical protein [Nitrospinota bacterium]
MVGIEPLAAPPHRSPAEKKGVAPPESAKRVGKPVSRKPVTENIAMPAWEFDAQRAENLAHKYAGKGNKITVVA